MRRRQGLTLGIVGLLLLLGGERSWANDPTHSDSLGNTAGGTNALVSDTTGGTNTAFGDNALSANTTGSNNTATGYDALFSNHTGGRNTATGSAALFSNTGDENTATGYDALTSNTTGTDNTATGVFALVSNATGSNNTAAGFQALFSNTDGSENTATGGSALASNTTGARNTATGQGALASNATGDANIASGFAALVNNTNGNANTASGAGALFFSTSGNRNTAVGFGAGGALVSGDDNIYLGNEGTEAESNTMRLGGFQARAFIAGVAGVTVTNSATVLINTSTGQLGTLSSSARYKSDIKAMGGHSRGLFQLRPVIFRYTQDTQGERQYGLIAEEVAKVYPELVTRNATGAVEAVRYHEVIPMLLNEVQQQQRQLAVLRAQNARLQATVGQLQERETALAARLERLEAASARTATLASR